MRTPASLPEWLEYIERIHPRNIDLGLDRVIRVKQHLGLNLDTPIVTVAGTNGKGSTCAMLESILLAAGHRVGLYTSPHLLRYNERVRIGGLAVDNDRLCRAFERVEAARRDVALTYFEFGTLAAWVLFSEAPLDALVLEVGLGGRLDAVNALDADCAIVTSIGIDHTEFLGDSREAIGLEKAGIFRPGRPAIVADPSPAAALLRHAREIGADLQCLGQTFGFVSELAQWMFWGRRGRRRGLPRPALRGDYQLQNASGCLAALDALADRLPVDLDSVRKGLTEVQWPGRFQVIPGRPTVVLDVAHNPQAAEALARNLDAMGGFPATHAVFGMLRDKDIASVCRAMQGRVTNWYAATLRTTRGAGAAALVQGIRSTDARVEVQQFESPLEAFDAACGRARENDRIVVFGSFYTVADVMAALAPRAG